MAAPKPYTGPREMKVTREELAEARIPLIYRDYCSHILIPLNKCRFENFSVPWRCRDLKNEYLYCQYLDYIRRIQIYEDEHPRK